MTTERPKFPVRYKSVTINVFPIRRGDSTLYQFLRADGRQATRATIEKAKRDAMIEAQTIYKGGLSISDLTGDQIRAIKRMIEVDPDLRTVDEFLLWHSRKAPKKKLGDALDDFLAVKEANRGRSAQNVKTLTTRLSGLNPLRRRQISSISVRDLPAITGAPRTRKNIRAAWITFFRWCAENEYLYGLLEMVGGERGLGGWVTPRQAA